MSKSLSFKSIPFIIALILVLSLITSLNGISVVNAQTNMLSINNVQVIPTYPRAFEPITIQASIVHVFALEFALISWSNDSVTFFNTSLTEINSQQFRGTIPGQNSGVTVTYVIYVKDVNGNTAQWPSSGYSEIYIRESGTPIQTPINANISLTRGTQMLNVSSAGLLLELHLQSSVELQVNLSSSTDLNTTYRVIHAISNTIRITVNDTAALDYALLVFTIDVRKAMNRGLHEHDFVAYTREIGEQWHEYPASIDFQRKSAIVNTTHFSEWVIASSDPKLDLELSKTPQSIIEDKEFSIETTVKNYGGSVLQNITLQVFHVNAIIVASGFEQASLPTLEGNEEKSLEWSFIATQIGEYTLVFVVTAGSNYSISQSFTFTVNSSEDVNTKTSFMYFPFSFLLLLLLPILLDKFKHSKYLS